MSATNQSLHDKQRAMLGIVDGKKQEKKKDDSWCKFNVPNFHGKYHHSKIKSEHPIPGSAVKEDMANREKIQGRQKRIQDKMNGIEKAHKQKVHIKSRQIAIKVRTDFESRLGDSIDKIRTAIEASQVADNEAMEKADIEQHMEYVPSFHDAVAKNRLYYVQTLLREGFGDIDGREPKFGNTALFKAVGNGHSAMSRVLLAAGANPNAKNSLGDTAIHWAWRSWGKEDRGSIQHAVKQLCTVDIVKDLLKFGADPNAPACFGGTALHDAARYGPIEVVRTMLEFKANHRIVNNMRQTPYEIAKQVKFKEAERLLQHWEPIADKYQKHEFVKEWSKFIRDPTASLVTTEPAQNTLDRITIASHQAALVAVNRGGMPVVDEVVTGPLDVQLFSDDENEDNSSDDEDEESSTRDDTGSVVSRHSRRTHQTQTTGYTRLTANLSSSNGRKRKKKKVQSSDHEVKKHLTRAQPKRIPSDCPLGIPLDAYLTGEKEPGFRERQVVHNLDDFVKDFLDAQQHKPKGGNRISQYSMTDGQLRDYLADDRRAMSRYALRRKGTAIEIANDGIDEGFINRPSTSSRISCTRMKKVTDDEEVKARRRKPKPSHEQIERLVYPHKRTQREEMMAASAVQKSSHGGRRKVNLTPDKHIMQRTRAQFNAPAVLPPPKSFLDADDSDEEKGDGASVTTTASSPSSTGEKKKSGYSICENSDTSIYSSPPTAPKLHASNHRMRKVLMNPRPNTQQQSRPLGDPWRHVDSSYTARDFGFDASLGR